MIPERQSNRMSKSDSSFEFKKHVGTIHSSGHLTLLQRKIANALLYNAYKQLLDRDEHQIHIGRLCELIGYDSHDHKSIKKALITLISTVIEWNLVDGKKLETEEGGVWNASAIIADASIDGSICTYSYSNKMRQLLYRPELYGRLNMQVLSHFKSTYGLALYENCIRYQNIKQTPQIALLTFRKLMGVGEGKYSVFKDFKTRVIDKAVQEVNNYSPIKVDPKFTKEGSKIVGVQFLIKRQEVLQPLLDSGKEIDKLTLGTRLQNDFGFSMPQIEKVLATYEEPYILEKIAIIESSASFKAGKIANLAKYLETALEQNYQAAKNSRDRMQIIRQRQQAIDEEKHQQAEKLNCYLKFQEVEIANLFETLTSREKKQLDKKFATYTNKSFYYDLFSKHGVSHGTVLYKFAAFVRTQRQDLLDKLTSFEAFSLLDNPKIEFTHPPKELIMESKPKSERDYVNYRDNFIKDVFKKLDKNSQLSIKAEFGEFITKNQQDPHLKALFQPGDGSLAFTSLVEFPGFFLSNHSSLLAELQTKEQFFDNK